MKRGRSFSSLGGIPPQSQVLNIKRPQRHRRLWRGEDLLSLQIQIFQKELSSRNKSDSWTRVLAGEFVLKCPIFLPFTGEKMTPWAWRIENLRYG
jgi:hypothetical protein